MKRLLFFFTLFFYALQTYGQGMPVESLFTLTSFSPAKFDNYLSKKGFAFRGNDVRQDTMLKMYDYRRTKSFKDIDSISRAICRAEIKGDAFVTYETASLAEFMDMRSQLKSTGFYYLREADNNNLGGLLYQHKDLTVRTIIDTVDNAPRYSMVFHKKTFPAPKNIYYANDLLTFTSHEYLVSYFGEKNVKKDIYYFSGNEVTKCSVLFLNTNRQVVFIWSDEANRCAISHLLFGGQQNLESAMESGKYVEENVWALKSGVRPGMSLMELRMLNGTDFNFHGGNSINTGAVIADNQGKLDFKKEEVLLSCLNCRDDKFSKAKVMNADDSIDEGRILFVLSVILNPL
ncbi:MAG: hypothetical protein ABIN01_06460 [Ferruginibacter sp.]